MVGYPLGSRRPDVAAIWRFAGAERRGGSVVTRRASWAGTGRRYGGHDGTATPGGAAAAVRRLDVGGLSRLLAGVAPTAGAVVLRPGDAGRPAVSPCGPGRAAAPPWARGIELLAAAWRRDRLAALFPPVLRRWPG